MATSDIVASGLGFTLVNGQIVATVAANVLTIAVKTAAGGDPSPLNVVYVLFPDSAGVFSPLGLTASIVLVAATSMTVSAGSTLGTVNNKPFILNVLGFNDSGTFRLAVINRWDRNLLFFGDPTPDGTLSNAIAEGGAGAADSALNVYAGVTITSMSRVLLGTLEWNSGLATAGNWSAGPDVTRLAGRGLPRPGQPVAQASNAYGTYRSGTTTVPLDDTIPQITEGISYTDMASITVTPKSAANLIDFDILLNVSHSVKTKVVASIFKDSDADALASAWTQISEADAVSQLRLTCRLFADGSAARTYSVRVGGTDAGTVAINGSAGGRKFGGVMQSVLRQAEIAG